MSFVGQDEQLREYQFRFRYLYIGLGVVFFFLISRLWYLQIIQGETFKRYSEENRIKRIKIKSPRGMIFDRNRTLVVDNRPAFDLEINPDELYSDKDWEETTIKMLSKMIHMPEAEILSILEASKNLPRFLSIKIKLSKFIRSIRHHAKEGFIWSKIHHIGKKHTFWLTKFSY